MAFAGVAFALAARLLSRGVGERARDRLITAFFGLLSPAVAAVAVAVVVSDGGVLIDRSLLAPSLCIAALAFLAGRFPRVVGFPCVVACGAALALLGYGVLGIPPAIEGTPMGVLVAGEGGTVSVRFGSAGASFREALHQDSPSPILVEALLVRLDRRWPLFGGDERMALTAVRFGAGGAEVHRQPLPLERLLRAGAGREPDQSTGIPGVRAERIATQFAEVHLIAGTRLGIYRSGGAVLFLP